MLEGLLPRLSLGQDFLDPAQVIGGSRRHGEQDLLPVIGGQGNARSLGFRLICKQGSGDQKAPCKPLEFLRRQPP